MRPRFAVRLLLLASLFLVSVAGCAFYPPQASVDLIPEFSGARKGSIVTGTGALGRDGFRSFLGTGMLPDSDGDWATSTSNQRLQAFGFFLYQPQSLTVSFNAQPAKAGRRAVVNFFINNKQVANGTIEPGSTDLTFEIASKDLQAGMNWIEIEGGNAIAWRYFQVAPTQAGRSVLNGQPVMPSRSGTPEAILLPFEQTLSYALEAPQQARLAVDFEPWQDPGTAPLSSEDLTLHVTLTQQDPVRQTEYQMRGGRPQTLRLPDKLGPFALTLRAQHSGPEPIVLGQLGVRLSSIRLERDQAVVAAPAEVSAAPRPESPRSGQSPNVILYLVDTLRADRLSLYGYRHPTSPELESIAKDAVIFDAATAESSWTKPTVASTMTSLEPSEHGVVDFADCLNDSFLTWAEILQQHGYQTSAVVANPLVGERFGFAQGFEEFRSVPVETRAWEVTNLALEWLAKRRSDQPFFLYLHTNDPHQSYDPSEPWKSQAEHWHEVSEDQGYGRLFPDNSTHGFAKLIVYLWVQATSGLPVEVPLATRRLVNALYDGEIASNDAAFGALVRKLKSEGLYDNTLIIFTSDHGEELFERGSLGHIHSLYQELIRVPLVIKFPQNQYSGRRSSDIWQQIDLLPTVLTELGIAKTAQIRGHSYPDEETLVSQRMAYFEVDTGRDAQEMGQGVSDYLEQGDGIRDGQWKLVHRAASFAPTFARGLFDLQADPQEEVNRILDLPVTALRLESKLFQHRNRVRRAVPSKKAYPEETQNILRSLQYLH